MSESQAAHTEKGAPGGVGDGPPARQLSCASRRHRGLAARPLFGAPARRRAVLVVRLRRALEPLEAAGATTASAKSDDPGGVGHGPDPSARVSRKRVIFGRFARLPLRTLVWKARRPATRSDRLDPGSAEPLLCHGASTARRLPALLRAAELRAQLFVMLACRILRRAGTHRFGSAFLEADIHARRSTLV